MVKLRKFFEILIFFKKMVDIFRSGVIKYKSFVGICCVCIKLVC